jgi:hypothetical protein
MKSKLFLVSGLIIFIAGLVFSIILYRNSNQMMPKQFLLAITILLCDFVVGNILVNWGLNLRLAQKCRTAI